MATSKEYVEFVCAQIDAPFAICCRKMFGEYMIYLDGKPALLVCDNCVYVKKLPVLAEWMKEAECGFPYQGAKEHYILDIENRELTDRILPFLVAALPIPKKK